MTRTVISTPAAPAAIGTYSQAIKVANTVYLSGQIPLVASDMTILTGDFKAQVRLVLDNLAAVCEAAGGSLKDIVKLNVYLTDLSNFTSVNEVMTEYFQTPYPARAAVQVAALPKGVPVEIDGIAVVA